jgi:hypothetical protein
VERALAEYEVDTVFHLAPRTIVPTRSAAVRAAVKRSTPAAAAPIARSMSSA